MRNLQNKNNQQGIVLAISLIVLLLITILAVSGMRSTIMEERMAGNSRNNNLAFQRAETALRAGEALLEKASTDVPTAKSEVNGTANNIGSPAINCVVALDSLDFHDESSWANSCTAGSAGTVVIPGLDKNKHKFYIEYLYGIRPASAGGIGIGPCFYRVTARGYGDTPNSYATVQSVYKFTGCLV